MVENIIKRKYIAKETHDVIRGIDSNHLEILNQYTVHDDLGVGSFSTVKLFFDNNNQTYYATKILNKKELARKKKGIKKGEDGSIIVDTCLKDALREIAILKNIECLNIIQLREIIHDDANSRIYLVMEFAENGPILDFNDESESFSINKYYTFEDKDKTEYSEDEIKEFLRGIVNGLSYRKYIAIWITFIFI